MITVEDATEALIRMAVSMKYFPGKDEERSLIVTELLAMINWPKDRVLKTIRGEVIPYVEPIVRLTRFTDIVCAHVREWPGLGELRAIYCQMYTPAHGADVPYSNVIGFTQEECESGSDVLTLARPVDASPPVAGLLPPPEFARAIGEVAKRLKA